MPSATARQFQNAAQRLGFSKTRQTGSHERWNHPDGRAVTIPIHAVVRLVLRCFSKFFGNPASRSKNFGSYCELPSLCFSVLISDHVGFSVI
jgi:predicted RNA binding protein YcfA (HicA-like mRNA interferase family)